MQRLDRSYVIVPHKGSELLDLFGGDFDGVVHDHPDDAFRTGWGGERSGIEVVGFSVREEVHRIDHMVLIGNDVPDF